MSPANIANAFRCKSLHSKLLLYAFLLTVFAARCLAADLSEKSLAQGCTSTNASDGKNSLELENASIVPSICKLSDPQYIPDTTLRIRKCWSYGLRPKPEPLIALQALVEFVVDDFGHFSNVRIVQSSGYDNFDDQALKAVAAAGKMNSARLPDDVGGEISVKVRLESIGEKERSVCLVSAEIVSETDLLQEFQSEEIDLEKAIQLNNDGVKALESSNFPFSVEKFRESLKANPTYRLARQNLAISFNNEGLQSRRDAPKALRLFHMASFVDSDNLTTEQNMNGVIELLGKNPRSFEDRLALADDCVNKNELNGAVVEYRAALKLKDDATTHKKLADVYHRLNEKEKAAAEYGLAARQLGDSSLKSSHKGEGFKENRDDQNDRFNAKPDELIIRDNDVDPIDLM
jgi:TonB family protein